LSKTFASSENTKPFVVHCIYFMKYACSSYIFQSLRQSSRRTQNRLAFFDGLNRTMPRVRLFITGMSFGRHGFNPRLFHVGSVVDNAALRQLFFIYFHLARQQLRTNTSH